MPEFSLLVSAIPADYRAERIKSHHASLLMSLESVFSVLAGWIFLHQALSGRELSGCILMFAAIVLVQLPGFSKTNAVS